MSRKTQKVIIFSACSLAVIGLTVGVTIGVKNQVDTKTFQEQAVLAFKAYYDDLASHDSITMGKLKVVYTDGYRYEAFLGNNLSVYLGTWDKGSNSFSSDSSKNYLMDVNSLGYRVVVNINGFKSTASEYRTDKKDEIIPAGQSAALFMIDKNGVLDQHTVSDYWGTPIYYEGQDAKCKYSTELNNKAQGQMFESGFEKIYETNYPGETLYTDSNKSTSWARVFASQESVVIHGAGEDDFPSSGKATDTFFPSYAAFCTEDANSFYYGKATPFSSVKSLVINKGITKIGDGQEGALSAFNNLNSLQLKSTTSLKIDSSFVFGKQTDSFNVPVSSIIFDGPVDGLGIADDAFNGLKSLTSLSYGYGTTQNETFKTGKRAFKNCTALKKIIFPEPGSVVLDEGAFNGCTAFAAQFNTADMMFPVPSNLTFASVGASAGSADFPFPEEMYLNFSDRESVSCQSFMNGYSGYSNYYYDNMVGTLEEHLNNPHELVTNIFSEKVTDRPADSSFEISLPASVTSIIAKKSFLIPYKHDGSILKPVVNSDIASGSIVLNGSKKTTVLKLDRDLTVYGSLQIGGLTNFASSTSYQGFVVGEYAELDLNGHTVTVEKGGSLDVAGNLTDSTVGKTGKVIVKNGGQVKSDFALCDFNGGTNTFSRLGLGVTPFNFYAMPYLNAKIRFEYGSSLVGYCVLFAAGSHNSIEVKMIGNREDSSLISWDTTENDSYIERTQEDYQTSVTTDADLSKFKEYYNFYGSFQSMPLEFGVQSGDMFLGANTGLFNFPVSPFIQAKFDSTSASQKGKMTMGNTFMLLPGSEVTATANEELAFAPSPKTDYFFRTGVWGQRQYRASYDFLKSGGITGIFDTFFARLGTSNKDAVLKIDGEVSFKELNGMPNYVLAGTVNASTNATNQIYLNKVKITDEAMSIVPDGYGNLNISSYTCSPLKLNGYYTKLDSELQLIEDTSNIGLFKDKNSSELYFFLPEGNKFTCQEGTVPPNFDYPVASSWYINDQKGSLVKADSYSTTDHVLTYNGSTYIYFNGVFVPYDSASGTANLSRFVGQSTDLEISQFKVSFDTSKEMWI